MGLPWFAFNIKDFLANTKRLNTEAKGAYICLMLDYYEQGEGAPDDDDVLATICELPVETWKRHRKVIEPLFEIKVGRWYHDRIQTEMLKASSKHVMAVAKATAAAHAKHAKSSTKDAPSKPVAEPKAPKSSKPTPSMPEARVEHAFKPSDSTLTSTLSNERVVPAKHDDDATKAEGGFLVRPIDLEEITTAAPEPESYNPLGTTLPETWIPGVHDIATAEAYGMNGDDIAAEVLTFHAYNAQNGTFSKNWSATWQMWCARWKERLASKPKLPLPRVEVNTAPTDAHWDAACRMWAKGSSTWSHKSLGPEPGQPRCRAPLTILAKHNIDPATGRVATPTKEPVS